MNIPPQGDESGDGSLATSQAPRESAPTAWVSRMTFVVGGICLLIALSVWLWRPGHYRLVLALLTVAMFAAILHAYTMENGHS